ncbi:hypothetical protein O0L34_g1775 [Tuta absoluta]|nr:hypothetical protein O0L34_g1775 [Tuta absoluta]
MGSVRGGPRPPNTTAYFVALGAILVLLFLLLCYFFYFFIKKVKELSGENSPLNEPEVTNTRRSNYPVQQGVRDSATAMAKMCKQLPTTGKGGTVFPAASSPAATHTNTGTERVAGEPEAVPVNPSVPEPARLDIQEKLTIAAPIVQSDVAAAS